jgi:RND family efflux transporter MFP subunit
VRAGQPLARLDDSDVLLGAQAAEDQVRAARVDAEQAATDASRFGRLAAEGSVGGADRERQQARADAAAARLDQAQRQMAMARNRLSYTTLQAPYDAVVTALLAEQGQVVAEGQPVLVLAREGQREVVADIPEDWVDRVRGAEATAIASAPDGDSAPAVPVRLRELSPAANAQGRTFRARFAAMPGAADAMRRWPLGSTARLQLALRDSADRGVRVPVSALVKGNGPAGVWVIGATGNSLVFQPVEVLGIEESALRVSGLEPGQRVVSVGAQKLDAGMTVRPVERPGGEPAAPLARSGS